MACSNRSRTREAPTPTYISTKSEPDMEKKGTPASPATARASRVLPVPGGPTSSTPFGTRAPSSVKRRGSFKNSTTSRSSSFSSSAPATSSKVVPRLSSEACLILAFPKPMILPGPPSIEPRERRMEKNIININTIKSTIGSQLNNQDISEMRSKSYLTSLSVRSS